MTALPTERAMYQAMANKDASFSGVFFIAVKTTKVFCRPGCPARTPKPENVEYYASAREAVFAGFRPCKRCKPLEDPDATPEWVERAISLVEQSGGRKVLESELESHGLNAERLRRWFKQRHGMTFQAYQRGLRLGKAMAAIKEGGSVLESGLFNGWDSTSGFRDAFKQAFGTSPQSAHGPLFNIARIESPLGALIAVADERYLYLLEFSDRRMMPTQMQVLQKRYGCSIAPGDNRTLEQTRHELDQYFEGKRQSFDVPIDHRGTDFQMKVWEALKTIPFGKTLSYGAMADMLGCPDAQRAVGKANGDNRLAIIVPCHRVVRADGTLCGYGGGLWRKKRLLDLEGGERDLFSA